MLNKLLWIALAIGGVLLILGVVIDEWRVSVGGLSLMLLVRCRDENEYKIELHKLLKSIMEGSRRG